MEKNLWEENVYKKNKQINKYPYSSIVSNIFKFTHKRDNKKILDIGCGTGNHLKFLAENNFDTYGIDISPSAVNISKDFLFKNNLQANVKVSDSSNLQYEDNFFDYVIDRASITHNPFNFEKCISEVHRVLKKDGIFFTEIFGKECSDIKYGEKINDNIYNNFTKGGFLDSDLFIIDNNEFNKFYNNFEMLSFNESNTINNNLKKVHYFEIVLKKN